MCLTLTKKSECKIAEKPIIVFKNGCDFGDRFSSLFYLFQYKQNVVTPIVNLKKSSSYNEIHEGYHSFVNILSSIFTSEESHLFIIPKGVLYIEGVFISPSSSIEFRSIVSSQIIWIGSIWNPFNWIKCFRYK